MKRVVFDGVLLVAVCLLIIYSCANRGYPEGGPKDEENPYVIGEVPESFNTNFDSRKVAIYFNEYVQLRDIQNKFMMSPPTKKSPRVSLRGKYIVVDFQDIQDTLRANTTYSLDFADAIVDNNESNPLGFYRYVFSTGSVIDTMELGGKVVDAQSQLPLLGMKVLLYENHHDSAAVREMPSYVARTDSSGVFRVTNIKKTGYRILVIDDANRDNMFAPEGEKVGFVDSIIIPVMERMTIMDTIRPDTTKVAVKVSRRGEVAVEQLTRDTIIEKEVTVFGPVNLFMAMFEEEETLIYRPETDRSDRERLDIVFNIPRTDPLKVRLLGLNLAGTLNSDNWYLPEYSAGNDTITLWIRDSLIYKIDSLRAELSYLASDSLRRLVPRLDTVRFFYKDKEATTSTRRRNRDEEEKEPELKLLEMTILQASTQGLNKPITIDFDKPIVEAGLKNIKLEEKVDTLWHAVQPVLEQDSLKIRRYTIHYNWKEDTEYRLSVDSMAIYSIYGLYNAGVEKTFQTRTKDSYGTITVNLKGVTEPVIVQLFQGDKDIKVVAEQWTDKSGNVRFEYMDEGSYMIRAIIDRNGNKRWDTGNYLKRIQPEEIKYHPVELSLKQNFDIEQEFDISKTYIREDPAKKKKEQGNTKDNRQRIRQ